MTALPDISGVPHPPTWLLYPYRWFGRFVVRRRFAVREHGTANVPAEGPVIVAANHIGVVDGPLLVMFGPRPVHALTKQEMFAGKLGTLVRFSGQIRLDRFPVDPRAVKTCLRVLADGHAVGMFPEGARGAGDLARFHRGTAYLALVSGAPVVPLTFLGSREPGAGTNALPPRAGRVDMVYGVPYRTEARPWPRTKKQVEMATLDLRVHMLVALAAARTLTGRQLPGPLPPGQAEGDPPSSVTPGGTR